MSALADIFAAVRLQLDGTGFEAQATALATKSGQNAGTAMSQKLSATFKKAAGGAIGAGLGLAFASATNGALDLNAAMSEFQAQTGASDAEAKAFQGTLIDLDKTNVQSIPEIADALTGLQLHFKLSGEAAKDLGAQFLDFSRVAGGTAREAVNRFDELVDAGVITVDQMATTMDQLTVSHQKFGVNINDTIGALVAFAPAMKAANISTDDAIGLMNLFSESGLNAEAATKAFNIALTKVHSPEELQKLMGDISNTDDDLLRAQKAVDLFGAKAGVKLANALKPGSGGLAAFSVNANDAAGATTKAGDALDKSFGNQAKLKLKEITGALAEMGTNLGDVLIPISLLGPSLTKGLFAMVGGIAGVLGPKLAEQVAIAWGSVQTSPAVLAAANTAGVATAATFAAGIAGVGIFQWLGDRVRDAWSGLGGVDFKLDPSLEAQIKKGSTYTGQQSAGAFVDGYTSVLAAGKGEVKTAASGIAAAVVGPVRQAGWDASHSMQDRLSEIVGAFDKTWGELASIASGTADSIYGPLLRSDKLAANQAEITAQKRIIASKHSTAQEKADATARLHALQSEGLGIRIEMAGRGELSKKQYDALITDLTNQSTHGSKAVRAQASLALAELKKLKAAAAAVPDLPTWLTGPTNTRRGMRAAGGPVSAGMPYIVGEKRAELFVPQTDGYIIPTVPSGLNLTVNVNPGGDTSLQTAQRFGQAVLDTVASGLREQRARLGATA